MPPLSEAEVQAHVRNIERDGYSIMPDAIAPAFLAEIREELDRLQSVRPGGDVPSDPQARGRIRRWFDLLNEGDVWQRVAVHPWLLQILPHVLGDGFLLSSASSAVIEPGEAAQGIHQDDILYEFAHPRPTLICNSIWALSDFTVQNGATRVVPGSHKWGHDPDPAATYQTVPLVMPAGAICPFVGGLFHAAGANASGADRYGLLIHYCDGRLRQMENFMLGISPGRMMTFPRELQDVLGFKTCRRVGNIWVQDPRAEMTRHYAPAADPYLLVRNQRHQERLDAYRERHARPATAAPSRRDDG